MRDRLGQVTAFRVDAPQSAPQTQLAAGWRKLVGHAFTGTRPITLDLRIRVDRAGPLGPRGCPGCCQLSTEVGWRCRTWMWHGAVPWRCALAMSSMGSARLRSSAGSRQAGTHIMGRVTYEGVAEFWPKFDNPVAGAMNDIPKVAFSRTLRSAGLPESGSPAVTRQRRSPGSRGSQVVRSSPMAGSGLRGR
jgi:hypothetical protein